VLAGDRIAAARSAALSSLKLAPDAPFDARVAYPGSSSLPDDGIVVGRLIANRYVIEQPCERSAASAIYRARHLPLDRTVLLRVLPERGAINRARCRDALSLAERVAALATPHVARTLDVGVVAERWPFVVSEYSRGKTLAAVLAQQGPLGLARVLPIARQLASVLALAHSARVRHGDLSLSGVWVESPSGRPDWVRMLDFGICELPVNELSSTSQSGVFPSTFRRPEAGAAFSAEAVRWDLRAFGAALHELTLGTTLRTGGDLTTTFEAQLAGRGGGGGEIVRSFARLVERCLVPAPEVAYRALDDVCSDLEGLAQMPQAPQAQAFESRPPVTSVHAPARRARVVVGGPKVIVRGG
jgi:serine/threonine protein kinase